MTDALAPRLEAILRHNPQLMQVLEALCRIGLPDWRLVAGAVYQSVWNALTDRPLDHGIKDWDLAYFDGSDLSWEAEDRVIRRVEQACVALPCRLEVRNQARVHLWFEQRFGVPYPPLRSTDDGFDRYASRVHSIGVRLEPGDRLDIIAPFGLEELFAMRILPNRRLANGPSHDAKARRAKALWPEVTGELWDGTPL